MKQFLFTIMLLGTTITLPAMAFESTTDPVVKMLYATQQVSSSFSNDKIVLDAKGDAATFVASKGELRGANIEAAFTRIRELNPDLKATDTQLAEAILAQ